MNLNHYRILAKSLVDIRVQLFFSTQKNIIYEHCFDEFNMLRVRIRAELLLLKSESVIGNAVLTEQVNLCNDKLLRKLHRTSRYIKSHMTGTNNFRRKYIDLLPYIRKHYY